MYYWITTWLTKDDSRQLVIYGYKRTQEEADAVGFERLQGNYEVFELPTTDRARATSMIKAQVFERGADLEQALKRAKHGTLENKAYSMPKEGGQRVQ